MSSLPASSNKPSVYAVIVRRLSLFAVLFALALLSSVAHADQQPQCTFSVSQISFGTVDLQKGNPYDAAATFSYACTGNPRQIVRICPSFGLAKDGTRWMTDSAGHKLFYNLYTDATRTTVWGTWFDKKIQGPTIDLPLGRSEKASGSVNIYARITANQKDVPPGAYSGKMNGRQAMVGYGDAGKGSCVSVKFEQSAYNLGLVVSANVAGAGTEAGPGALTAPDATQGNPSAGSAPQATGGGAAPKQSLMQKLKENAEYQQQQQNKAGAASNDNGAAQSSSQEDRAKYIESHSCMTTMGADEANELADECNKVTSGSHAGCNIQENTCDEIRKTTQKGCWGLAASAPDFCLTKYR